MAKVEKLPCVEFAVWVNDGEQAKACTHIGTMVTIGLGRRIFGLSPMLSSSDPKIVSIALFGLKSHHEDVSKGKLLSRVDVAFGKVVSLEPNAPIKFRVKPRPPQPRDPAGRCCVTCSYRMCASCEVKLECGSCCVGKCCKEVVQ